MRESEGQEPDRGAQADDRRAKLRSRPTIAALVIAVVIAGLFLVHLRAAWIFTCDDAYISFRYARNLGEHGALAYNLEPLAGIEGPVEGYTNFLWVLVLALGVALGVEAPTLAAVLTAAASLASLLLVALICARLRRAFAPPPAEDAPLERGAEAEPERRPAFEIPDLVAPALLVAVPEFVVWGSGGLETSFALALGLFAIWAWLGGRVELAALAAGLAGLTRPDALVWIAGFGLGWLAVVAVRRWRTRGALELGELPWARVGLSLAIFVALVGGQLVFRWLYYGEWLPNTWAVKRHGALLRTSWGLPYLRFWADRLGLVWALPAVFLLRPRHLALLLPLTLQLFWAWSVGGDFMAYGRFLLPATALVALLIGLALAELHTQLRTTSLGLWTTDALWILAALAPIVFCAWRIPGRIQEDRDHGHLHIGYDDEDQPLPDTPGFEGVQAMDRFAAVRVAAGEKLGERLPPDTVISVGAAGALPYASGLPAFDAYGLVDPGVAELAEPRVEGGRPGHQLYAPASHVEAREPDLICHVGWSATRPPTRRDARRRGGPGRAWACVETGPIPDRRAEGGALDSRWYCCLRDKDRFRELDPREIRRRKREEDAGR